MKKIVLSDVFKKDLKVGLYLLIFGGVTYIVKVYFGASEFLSIVFGGLANYIVYRITKEIENEGYLKALGK
jgi:hypothetical protein